MLQYIMARFFCWDSEVKKFQDSIFKHILLGLIGVAEAREISFLWFGHWYKKVAFICYAVQMHTILLLVPSMHFKSKASNWFVMESVKTLFKIINAWFEFEQIHGSYILRVFPPSNPHHMVKGLQRKRGNKLCFNFLC